MDRNLFLRLPEDIRREVEKINRDIGGGVHRVQRIIDAAEEIKEQERNKPALSDAEVFAIIEKGFCNEQDAKTD